MRNFEPWRDSGEVPETEEERIERLENEHAADDPMAALESKTVDSKREMDILDKLQEIRNKNARNERADKDNVLDTISSRPAIEVDEEYETLEAEATRKFEAEEDEAEVRRVFSRIPQPNQGVASIELNEAIEEEAEDGESTNITRPSSVASTSSTIKRKLADVEPDALSLLSEDAKRFAASSAASAPSLSKKKKKAGDSAMAAKFGIKVAAKDVKGKGKA